ncbi:VOC family protein [Streptomyces sp. NPDC048202]|uniref:VOC family protein n=1 Tax=Streptomyces sp. NPDC048202 TaxID=3365514 RepID=UPI00372020EB
MVTSSSRTEPLHWKVVVDAVDPHAQADFWGAALHYEPEDNSGLIERLLGVGALSGEATVEYHGRPAFRDLVAVRHPEDPYDAETGTGLGRRVLFQRVPEAKDGKNRLHLDLHAGPERREGEVARLTALGATVLRDVSEPGGSWTVLADPEGNEFCVQ